MGWKSEKEAWKEKKLVSATESWKEIGTESEKEKPTVNWRGATKEKQTDCWYRQASLDYLKESGWGKLMGEKWLGRMLERKTERHLGSRSESASVTD